MQRQTDRQTLLTVVLCFHKWNMAGGTRGPQSQKALCFCLDVSGDNSFCVTKILQGSGSWCGGHRSIWRRLFRPAAATQKLQGCAPMGHRKHARPDGDKPWASKTEWQRPPEPGPWEAETRGLSRALGHLARPRAGERWLLFQRS